MKLLIFFITIILFVLSVACNGKRNSSPEKNNLTLIIDTVIVYEPKEYQEKIIDTVLDSEDNIRVIIKMASRMDQQVSQIIELDSTRIKKICWRDNSLSFRIFVEDQLKFDTTVVKEALIQIGDDDFLKKSILYSAWIDNYDKELKTVIMGFNVIVPDTDWAYEFSLSVDNAGKNELLLNEIK